MSSPSCARWTPRLRGGGREAGGPGRRRPPLRRPDHRAATTSGGRASHETLERAIDWYHERLLAAPDAAAARGYLRRQRGYDGDVVRRYRLGWAPEGRDELVRSLGVPASALVDAGLAAVDESGRYTDFFRGRLPLSHLRGGRTAGRARGRLLPGGRGPKYKNTPSTAVYDKSRVLYGLNWAKKTVVAAGRVVVCEGYTDVIGLQRAGIGEAVATCGTALAEGHVRLLKNFATQIVLAFDADAAGQAAAERLYEWERRFDVDIRVAVLPPGADPADLAHRDPDGPARPPWPRLSPSSASGSSGCLAAPISRTGGAGPRRGGRGRPGDRTPQRADT